MVTSNEINELLAQSLKASVDFFKDNRNDEAEVLLKQMLNVDPYHVDGLKLLGLVHHKKKEYREAIGRHSQALSLADNAETHNNLALSLSAINELEPARKHLEDAIRLNPEVAHFHSNLGLQLRRLGQNKEAIISFERALEIKEDAYTWLMLGGVYGERNELEQAEFCILQALFVDSDCQEAHVDLAYVYFLQGRWAEAWPQYEHRFQTFEQAKFWRHLYPESTAWHGEDLTDKRIVLYCEQGAGDAIHFARYIPNIKALGGHVILHCSAQLEDLLRNLPDEISTIESKIVPNHDCHASLMSLPYLLNFPEIPLPPYLFTTKIAKFDEYDQYFKIGIAWAGNPQHPNDSLRSCHLHRFKPIHDLPRVKLFSLQKDLRKRMYCFSKEPIDLADAPEMKIVDLSQNIEGFEDTAAAIQQMDLIISVDTAVLHLAGALNKRAWGLLPFAPDWRWKVKGNSTVWYPYMELFRQPNPGNWDDVFQQITNTLKQELS